MNTTKDIGLNIKHYRLSFGLTQIELAHRIGFKKRQSIDNLEHGSERPSLAKLFKIATALEIPVEFLLLTKYPKNDRYSFVEIIGKNLKLIRVFREFNMGQLASAIGVTQYLVAGWENGKRRICRKNFDKLCQILNVAPICLTDELTFSAYGDFSLGTDSHTVIQAIYHKNCN